MTKKILTFVILGSAVAGLAGAQRGFDIQPRYEDWPGRIPPADRGVFLGGGSGQQWGGGLGGFGGGFSGIGLKGVMEDWPLNRDNSSRSARGGAGGVGGITIKPQCAKGYVPVGGRCKKVVVGPRQPNLIPPPCVPGLKCLPFGGRIVCFPAC